MNACTINCNYHEGEKLQTFYSTQHPENGQVLPVMALLERSRSLNPIGPHEATGRLPLNLLLARDKLGPCPASLTNPGSDPVHRREEEFHEVKQMQYVVAQLLLP